MQTLEEQIRYRQEQVNKMPQAITLDQAVQRDDANSILQALPSYKDNSLERFAKGAISGLQSMSDITPSLEIYGQQIDLAIGGYFGAKPETINRKALNLATSYRNMQAKQQERYKYSNPEDVNSWAYGIGQGAFNYGLMLVGGGLVGAGVKAAGGAVATQLAAKTAAGLGANVLLENVEQQSERMPLNEENQINSEQITPEWAKSSAIGTTAYLATSTLLEKGFGFGKQVKMWETPIKSSNKAIKISSPIVKQAGKTALSEGATEGLQSLASTGILLVEGKIDASQLPERLQDAWKEAVIGGLLGGTAGTAVAINQAHNVKTMLNDEISKVVTDPEECEKVVDAIYESGTAEMTNVISKELELSSELNAKHGAIYDSMQGAIYDAINNAGAFQGVEETEIAQYVSDTSKMFANQVLAEANKRGVLIDEVLKASDIKFENGRIYMQAGKEVIAETQAVSEETNAEIVEEETSTRKVGQSYESDYAKRKKKAAYDILATATGKSAKWLRMQLGADSKHKGMIKRQEFIEELAKETGDNIAGSDGMLPEWREFYTYKEGETDADYDLAMQALNDILNNNFKDPEQTINKYENDYANYIQEEINKLKSQFDNAKTFDELDGLFNNLDNLPDPLQADFVMDELVKSYVQNIERLENEQNGKNKESERNTGEISESNFGTTQTSNVRSVQGNTNQIQGQTANQEINPDTKLYQETDQDNKNLIMTHSAKTEYLDDIIESQSLIAPSMAITNKNQGTLNDFGFGDIIFIRNPEKIDYKRDNIYDRDIYSPRMPQPLYRTKNGYNTTIDSYEYDALKRQWENNPEDFKEKHYGMTFDEYFKDAEKVLFKGYTSSGKRKYVPYTAENIIKEMKSRGTVGGENWSYGLSSFLANLANKQKNLKQLKERANEKLGKVEQEVIQELKDQYNNFEDDLRQYAKEDYKSYSFFSDIYPEIMKAIAPIRTNEYVLNQYLDMEKLNKEDAKLIEDVKEFLQTAIAAKRTYFESKPMREMPIDEFSAVLVTKDVTEEQKAKLRKLGLEVIEYNGNDANEALNNAINQEKIFFQLKNTPKQPKIFKGAYDVSAKAIELFKDADYSTLPHELAHYWLDNMWGYYRSGKASEAYSNNFKGVLDWLEVKDGQINLTRNQQEKFARGYEKYLLNGYAPNGLIQGAFDDYDKWLQKVYNDARELKVKLTPDAIEFFDTMTTGELPEYDVPETQAEIREKNIEQMNKDIETARKFVVEKQAEYNNFDGGNVITKDTVPVTAEGEKKQSRAYTNQASILGIAEELNYNKTDIAEQNRLASEYVKNNLDEARQVVNGEKEAPSDILKNAIYNAYLKEMLAIGDNEAYVNALKNQSLELTRAGQEIASQRGAIENIFDSGYWIRRIESLKKSKLASQKFGKGFTASEQEQALSKMNDFIKNKVEAIMPEFMKATAEEQQKIAEKLSKEIAAEFKVKPDTKLYQSMYEPSEVRTRTNAYNYIYRYINSALGLDLTKAQYNEIIAKTMAIQKSIETTRNRNGNPSALFFKNISEMENYANSIEPSPALAILTSTVGRGNMLFSPKTIALNIESNIVNFFTEAITRRISNQATNMAVDPQVIKDYLAYSREVFNTSGYQVSSMPSLDPTTQILSEKMTTTAGDRVVDKLGRFFEQTIFKYGLGAPDLFFKDMTFVDTANVLATKEAKGDSKKATELFKDICLIEPKTAKGKELREIAINEALVATYQNKGKTSDLALGIRNAINKASGSANLGDMLSPFVKTPANVIGLGFDYSMGGLIALKNIQTIYNDIQQGTFTETTRKSLRSLARNGIGFVASAMIASLIDDDDYIPEYALLDAKQRELVKMKGGVFNSVKIGNKYISLDYFGPLAMPLVSMLNARRGYDAKSKVWNYFQGSAYQSLKLPVIGDIKSLLEGTGRTLTKDIDTNLKMLEDAAIDFVASRSIPAIVTDIAKMTDEYERETNNNAINRLKSKVPIIREELPMQYNYGTGQPRETQNPVSQLFAGARVKEEITSPVIRELDRLYKKNTDEQLGLSKITKAGKLSSLSENQKNKIEKDFAKLYATKVSALVQTQKYQSLDNNDKVKAINKVRNSIRDDLKREYGLEKPKRSK